MLNIIKVWTVQRKLLVYLIVFASVVCLEQIFG